MKKTILVVVLLLSMVLVMGCTSNENEPAGENNLVKMENGDFVPKTIEITAGETITWVNNDTIDHTITGFEVDKTLSQGEEYTHTFNEEGTFPYDCTLHPRMNGTVVVN